jgi:hypothetical protein
MMLILIMRRHHLRLDRALVAVRWSAFAIVILVIVRAAIEVSGTLVFVRATVLRSASC